MRIRPITIWRLPPNEVFEEIFVDIYNAVCFHSVSQCNFNPFLAMFFGRLGLVRYANFLLSARPPAFLLEF